MFYYVVTAVGNSSTADGVFVWPPLLPHLIIFLHLDLVTFNIFGAVSELLRTLLISSDMNPT